MNALEDTVESYLRQVLKCTFVEKNIFTGQKDGEVDAIGIIMSSKQVVIVEAAAGKRLYGSGAKTVDKIRVKFQRAIRHVQSLNHLANFQITLELWAPHIGPIRKANLEGQKILKKPLIVIDRKAIIQRLSDIQNDTKNSDLKTLDGVSQLLRILPDIKP